MERSKKEYRIPEVKEVGRVAVSTLGPPPPQSVEIDPTDPASFMRLPD